MKNISLILNGVLLVAVIVLYVLFLSNHSSSAMTSNKGTSGSDVRIGLINSDTVLKYYNYMDEVSRKLELKGKKMQEDYQNRAESLQHDYEDYQRRMNSFTLSQVRAIQADLGKKQENLRMYEQTLSQEMADEQNTVNKELYTRVTEYLKKYGNDKGLNLVFKFDPTSDVLFAGDSLDITWDVVDGLNKDFNAEKLAAAKADSLKRAKRKK